MSFWSRVQRASVERLHIRLELLLVLVALSAVMAVISPYFLSLSNFLNILLATSTIGVLAIAATFVIGSGGLDLSLGSVMGLAGVAGAFVAVRILGWPSVFAVCACIIAGGLAGYINGQLVTRAFVPAFIVTLGMLGLARGLALVISQGRAIYGLPPAIVYIGQGRPFGIPMPVILLVLTAIVAHCLLAYTRFGYHLDGAADAAGRWRHRAEIRRIDAGDPILPRVGVSSPTRERPSVVLPEPDSPTRPTLSPGPTSSDTPFRAWTCAPGGRRSS